MSRHGWTNKTFTHYLAVFACYYDKPIKDCVNPPLALALLLDESDFGASSHCDFIKATLKVFGKMRNNLAIDVGDNENLYKFLVGSIGKSVRWMRQPSFERGC